MKKSINRQKKYNNKNKKYKNRKIYNNTSYQYSSKSQTLGVGKTSVRVTRFYSTTASVTYSDYTINIISDAVSSPEFVRMATDYNYAKLKLVTITISPRTMETTSMNFFKIDWYNNTAEDVRYDDNAKLIYTNVTYPKIYRFRPPNVLLKLDSNLINYSEWLISNLIMNTSMPGCLKLTSIPQFTFQVETKWVFRGLKSIAPTNRILKIEPKASHNDELDEVIFDLKMMAHKLDKIEEKEEQVGEKENDL